MLRKQLLVSQAGILAAAVGIAQCAVEVEWRSHLGGSSTTFNPERTIDRRIMRAQRGDQPGQRSIACDFAEVKLGFEHPGRGPSENHHPACQRSTRPANRAPN